MRALRLFRRTRAAASVLRRPGSPRLPHAARPRALHPAFVGLVPCRDPLTSAGSSPFVFCSTGYRSRGTRQISLGQQQQTSRPSRRQYTRASNANRASPLAAGSPSTTALRRFTFVRHGRAPTTPSDLPSRGSRSRLLRVDARGLSSAAIAVGFPALLRLVLAKTLPSRCSGTTPLSPRCRVPCVRAPGLDSHLLSVAPAWRAAFVRALRALPSAPSASEHSCRLRRGGRGCRGDRGARRRACSSTRAPRPWGGSSARRRRGRG